MSYEIPQELQYQEKIIFGLTFQQLMYAVIFSPLAIAFLLKTPFPLPVRIALALIPSGLAAIGMFTKIPQEAKNLLRWLRWQKIERQNMKRYLGVEKIENNFVYLQ